MSIVLNATEPPGDATNLTCTCQNAQVTHLNLMHLNGNRLQILPVDWNVSNLFSALDKTTFIAPKDEFLVVIVGYDEHGYHFQRISSTVVPGQAGRCLSVYNVSHGNY